MPKIDRDTQTYAGQLYRRIGEHEHTRLDGIVTRLSTWSSLCATCGRQFEFKSPSMATKFAPSRRCVEHRKPGARVGRNG